MKKSSFAVIALPILLSFISVSALQTQAAVSAVPPVAYPDNRPGASWRMEAIDQGVVLKHGDGPDGCDSLGAREALIFEEKGVYHLFYDGAGPRGWVACQATSTDLKSWEKKGPVLDLGAQGAEDSAAACSPWVYFDGTEWHMFKEMHRNALRDQSRSSPGNPV